MKTLTLLGSLAALAIATVCGQPESSDDGSMANLFDQDDTSPFEIVGGNIVSRHWRSPWVVGLRFSESGKSICGGALITRSHVLTAAHCYDPDLEYAAIDTYYSKGKSDGEYIRLKAAYIHPEHNNQTLSHDFMILELEEPSSVKPVDLSDMVIDSQKKQQVTVQGWGVTEENGEQPRVLKYVDLNVRTNRFCNKALKNLKLDDSMFCAGGEYHEDSCQGDSGGPVGMMINEEDFAVVGVVSWGEGCGRKGKPGVYGRISSAASFIKQVIPGFEFIN